MSPTKSLLSAQLQLILSGLLITACGEKEYKDGGQFCINIEEDAECPSPAEVTAQYLPMTETCGSQRYHEAIELVSQNDSPYVSGGGPEMVDTGNSDPEGDSCCYSATYEAIESEPCAIGRPYLQDDEPVLAQLGAMGDWSSALHVDGFSDHQLNVAGAFYLEVARFEHASVASFNRFARELIRFGAPAELLLDAQLAAQDEIRHAQSAFSLANGMLGSNHGPGRMAIDGTLSEDFLAFTAAVLDEAAIQETLAVLLAAEQLRQATHPQVRAYLSSVVEDEARHSELAWRTLRWCISVGGAPVRELIESRLQSLTPLSVSSFPENAIPALGLPGRTLLATISAQGIEKVIRPSLLSLLSEVNV